MKRIQKQRHKKTRFFNKKPAVSSEEASSQDSSEFFEKEQEEVLNNCSLLSQLSSQDPKQQEFATSLLANLSTEITSQQINQLFPEEILQALLEVLRSCSQTQVLLNVFAALQALVLNEDQILERTLKKKKLQESQSKAFEKTDFLINRGLFVKFEEILRQCLDSLRSSSLLTDKTQAKLLVLKLLGALASFFEVLPEEILEKNARNLTLLIQELLLLPENDVFLLEILNILQIFVEFRVFVDPKLQTFCTESSVSNLKAIFLQQTGALSPQNLELLQAKAYLLQIFSQIFEDTQHSQHFSATFKEEILQETVNFLENIAKCPFLRDFEELGKLCEGANPQELLGLWLKEAKIIETSLIFLNNLLENEQEFESCSDFEEEKLESEGIYEKPLADSYKSVLLQEIFSKRGPFFLQNILKNLIISKENAGLFEKYEKNGLQEAVSAVCYASFLSISAINAAFLTKSAAFPLEKTDKREFFELFSQKMLDLLSFQQEIAHFASFEDFFTRFLGVFVDFLQENRDMFIETAVFARVFPINCVISLCNLCITRENPSNKDLFAFSFELLSLRLPITLTNSAEFALKPEEVEEIIKVFLKSMEIKKGFVQANALNALFDVFSDETYNIWLKNLGVIDKLECLDASKLKKNKARFFRDTVINLQEFIKYKRKLGV